MQSEEFDIEDGENKKGSAHTNAQKIEPTSTTTTDPALEIQTEAASSRDMESDRLTRSLLFPMSEVEWQIFRKMVGIEGTNERNVLRKALRLLAQELGIEHTPNIFKPRNQGNTTKSKSKPVLSERKEEK